jgi:hypothetical protein
MDSDGILPRRNGNMGMSENGGISLKCLFASGKP